MVGSTLIMKVLITGFGPFKGFDKNPSSILVNDFLKNDVVIRKEIFDVNREDIETRYPAILEDFQPDFILNIGLNANSGGFNLETFAINSLKDNLTSSNIKSEIGFQTEINTTLLSDHLSLLGIPTVRSDYAGSYYCNFIYYLSLEWCKKNSSKALFLHIPFTTELAGEISLNKKVIYPSLPKQLMLNGIDEIINFINDKVES